MKKEELVELAKYLSIISHASGRIRFRVSPKIKQKADEFKDVNIEDATNIDGIKSVKVNKLIGSITIAYEPNIFPSQMWDELVDGKIDDEFLAKLDKLLGKEA